MRRHHSFFCFLTLLILISNQRLSADDRLTSEQREPSTSATTYDRSAGDYLPLDPVPANPRQIIAQWSAASRFLSPVTPSSKVEKFKKGHQAYFSGHELTLISEFQQPVAAQALLADYDWQVVRQTKTNIILRGQPRDVLTRHLCRPFELQINPQSMLPESLTFLSDPSKQKQGFAAIELTAYKVMQPKAMVETNSPPQSVLRKVAKAVFPQEGTPQNPAATMGPIKRISFSTSSSDDKHQAEVREIEKLVARWIAESQRIDSIKLGNGTIIFKPSDHPHVAKPQRLSNMPDGAMISGWPASLQVLHPWLIDVDQKTFLIESFSIELSTDDTVPAAPRLITLKIKPNPAHTPVGEKWDAVEIEFNSHQPLPVKISEIRDNWLREFLLSEMQVQYKK